MTETQVLKSGGDTATEALLESCFCLNSNEVEPNCVPTFEPLLLFAVPVAVLAYTFCLRRYAIASSPQRTNASFSMIGMDLLGRTDRRIRMLRLDPFYSPIAL